MNRSAVSGRELATGKGSSAGIHLPRVWTGLAVAAATLAMAGNIVVLLAVDGIYGAETPALPNAAIAQDIVGLVVLGPLLLALALGASRGSLGSWLCLLGGPSFTTYNYAIYALSIQFGPLFLVCVAVLGLSSSALVGGLATADRVAVVARFAGTAVRGAGWFLIVVAALFGLLWLNEIVRICWLAGRRAARSTGLCRPTRSMSWISRSFCRPSPPAASCSCGATGSATPPPPGSWSSWR